MQKIQHLNIHKMNVEIDKITDKRRTERKKK